MRELHGFTTFLDPALKHEFLFFDRLVVHGAGVYLAMRYNNDLSATLSFLAKHDALLEIPEYALEKYGSLTEQYMRSLPDDAGLPGVENILNFVARSVAGDANTIDYEVDVVPICQTTIPMMLPSFPHGPSSMETTMRVALNALPLPEETTSLDDILAFKSELRNKQWGFRRFLKALSTKHQTEGEIRDEIEWMVSEYAKAMKIHHIKASQGFIEVYLLPVVEIAEDLVKFNWSKIAKGALAVEKRKVELLEAELKAPGRECAYVFDARKRFGKP